MTLSDLTPAQRHLLALVVAWDGYLETGELVDEAGLDSDAVTRRDLPRLRELGLVAPSLYQPTDRSWRCHGPPTAERIALALSKWGPMSRAQLAERAGYLAHIDATGFPPPDDWEPPSPRSGAFKRALAYVVEVGAALPASCPVATELGASLLDGDPEAQAVRREVEAIKQQWAESVRRVVA